jgi:4-hydroxybenzoate polyprenyltransferase
MSFIKYSALIPSLIATIFTFYGQFIFGEAVRLHILYLSFSGTFIGYTLISFFSLNTKKEYSKKQTWIDKNRLIFKICLFLCAIIAGSQVSYLKTNQLFNYIHLALIVFLYEKSFFNFHFRKVPWLKPMIVTYTWVMACLGTVFFTRSGLNPLILLEGFLSILPLCLFFDIRDFDRDTKNSFKTTAHLFGVMKIKSAAIRLYIISLLVRMTFISFAGYWWLYTIELILFLIISGSIKPEKDGFKYLILVDGFIVFKYFYVLEHLLE